MKTKVSKEQWVSMFEAIGLSEEKMMAWHRVFETRHPEAHAEFLGWLEIDSQEIKAIRNRSQK